MKFNNRLGHCFPNAEHADVFIYSNRNDIANVWLFPTCYSPFSSLDDRLFPFIYSFYHLYTFGIISCFLADRPTGRYHCTAHLTAITFTTAIARAIHNHRHAIHIVNFIRCTFKWCFYLNRFRRLTTCISRTTSC